MRIQRKGAIADLAAICHGFYLVAAAGRLLGIDPGRPGVPTFGRKLYHTNVFNARASNGVVTWRMRAIERKAAESLDRLEADGRLPFWADALDHTLEQLAAEPYAAIVLDYDGTLCNEDQRFEPLPKDVVRALTRLLQARIFLGIATGRGKSVRQRLRESISQRYWSRVIVGYYNGSQIIPLASDVLPDAREEVGHELSTVAAAINADRLVKEDSITLRPKLITINTQRGLSLDALCEHAQAIVNRTAPGVVRVMRSGHSIDIVPESVSKSAVVSRLQELLTSDASHPILRIGDRGRWPGNDSQLLASPHGLSVHEVSSDPQSCWNLAPPGYRGPQATLWYLSRFRPTKRGLRFRLPTPVGE
jgi:hydroxymethylpyrimidine pyrophosphatase-like HAD family hydrolase